MIKKLTLLATSIWLQFFSISAYAQTGYCSYSAEDDYFIYHSYLYILALVALGYFFFKGPGKDFGESHPGWSLALIVFGGLLVSYLDGGQCNQYTGEAYQQLREVDMAEATTVGNSLENLQAWLSTGFGFENFFTGNWLELTWPQLIFWVIAVIYTFSY